MPGTPPDDAGRTTRPFADVIRDIDKGRLHAELSDKTQELIAAVMDVRKAGTIQVTIKVEPSKASGMVEVSATTATKTPKTSRTSMFFVDSDHNLRRDNPDQPTLPLRGLPGGTDAADTANDARSAR